MLGKQMMLACLGAAQRRGALSLQEGRWQAGYADLPGRATQRLAGAGVLGMLLHL